MPDWLGNCWYDFCYSIAWATMTAGFNLRSEGRRHVPTSGPVLLVANHQSFFDPPCIGLSTSRRLCYLARKTLFKPPLVDRFLRSLKGVPVDQEGIAAAGLKATLDQLSKGEAVLVFPEGERSWSGAMLPFKPGISLLIKKARPPIVPIGIAGAAKALPRGGKFPRLSPIFLPSTGSDIAVSIGKPLDGERFAAMPREVMLEELFREIRKMQERAERLRRKP